MLCTRFSKDVYLLLLVVFICLQDVHFIIYIYIIYIIKIDTIKEGVSAKTERTMSEDRCNYVDRNGFDEILGTMSNRRPRDPETEVP